MSTRPHDEPLVESLPAQVGAKTATPSRLWSVLGTTAASVAFCGVLWWIFHTAFSDTQTAKKAIRAMESWDSAVRVSAIQDLETAGRGNGRIALPPLIGALGDESAEVRKAAAIALGPIGISSVNDGSLDDVVRSAITALLGALKDPQPAVRVAAANALASLVASKRGVELIDPKLIDPKAAVVTVTESLKDPNVEFRQAALRLLAVAAPASGLDPPRELADALKDELAGNRLAAVHALISFPRGLDPWIPALFQVIEADKDPTVRQTVGTRVAVIHPPALSVAAIPGLIAALGRPDAQVRNTAASILMSFGPEARAAIPPLIAMARETWSDSTEMDRRRFNLDRLAIQALTKIAVKTESAGQVVAALTELVQEKSPTRCAAAVAALSEFGPAAELAVPGLIRALPWRLPVDNSHVLDPPVVITALARIAPGTKSAGDVIAALGKAARTGEPGIQWAAADVLGDFGPAAESAVPDLIRAIEAAAPEKRYQVTWRASVALGRIAPGTKSAGDAIAALHALLRFRPPEPNFQIAAADALGDFGPAAEPAVPDLIQILKKSSHDEAEVQVMSTVAGALARIAPGTPSSEEAIRILTGALDSKNWFIKQDAIKHLGQLGPRAAGAIPRLRALTQDGMPVIRKVAEEALATIEGRK